MIYNPLSEVIDEAILVSPASLRQLKTLREKEKFDDLPGVDTMDEQARLSAILNELLDRLIADIPANPKKLRVMSRFQTALEAIQTEDTEGRERFGTYLEEIMDILNIESSDGLINFYF